MNEILQSNFRRMTKLVLLPLARVKTSNDPGVATHRDATATKRLEHRTPFTRLKVLIRIRPASCLLRVKGLQLTCSDPFLRHSWRPSAYDVNQILTFEKGSRSTKGNINKKGNSESVNPCIYISHQTYFLGWLFSSCTSNSVTQVLDRPKMATMSDD